MPTYEASARSSAPAEAVWAAWTDVAEWNAFDHIEEASIDGAFAPGATITSKPKGLPKSSLKLTRVEPPSLWVDESRSPGLRMAFHHVIEPGPDGTTLTERAEITGPLAPLVGPLLKRRLLRLFEQAVRSTATRAEQGSAA